ncbi:MAG TPA: T9SS type A sorting domain-containing protein [Candidatus Kapabacteria bacterium]|nr:T9SS type A sorting domain-containing protein [Candidatus Kapabacteria bacterium]
MKTVVVAVMLLLSFSLIDARGQGTTPYWELLPGPPGFASYFLLANDSQRIATSSGSAVYIYSPQSKTWIVLKGAEGLYQPIKQMNFAPHYAQTFLTFGDTSYAAYHDTVYYTTDYGNSWKLIGSFGGHHESAIVDIIRMTDSHIVILNDSSQLFVSADRFTTIDTEHAPDFARAIWEQNDTLTIATIGGKLYESSDLGKHWRLSFDLNEDSTQNYFYLTRKNNFWVLRTSHNAVSNYSLWISLDHGASWRRTLLPDTMASLAGIDNEGRIYISDFYSAAAWRSDDTGLTWKAIVYQFDFIIARDNTLYADGGGSAASHHQLIFFSSNYGDTWDTVSYAGIACVPIGMTHSSSPTWLSALDSVYYTHDNGATWNGYSSVSGMLSTRPDSVNAMMLNTTEMIYPIGLFPLCNNSNASGIGVITSHLNVWLATSSVVGTWEESLDTGCDYESPTNDTISSSPIVAIIETNNDTVLAISKTNIVRSYSISEVPDTVTPEKAAMPTGAVTRDSSGVIYIAMDDGSIFYTRNNADTWEKFSSPITDISSVISSLASGPQGYMFAVDSNKSNGTTSVFEYSPKGSWSDITTGLRTGSPDSTHVTTIWCNGGYAFAGTSNMGLFRGINPIVGNEAVTIDYLKTNEITLAPNPAQDMVECSWPGGAHEIVLVDVLGHIVQSYPVVSSAMSLHISMQGLAAGTYFVRVSFANGTIETRTLVVE